MVQEGKGEWQWSSMSKVPMMVPKCVGKTLLIHILYYYTDIFQKSCLNKEHEQPTTYFSVQSAIAKGKPPKVFFA